VKENKKREGGIDLRKKYSVQIYPARIDPGRNTRVGTVQEYTHVDQAMTIGKWGVVGHWKRGALEKPATGRFWGMG